MKIRPALLMIAITLVAFGINVTAQKLWTLEECINYAFENNMA